MSATYKETYDGEKEDHSMRGGERGMLLEGAVTAAEPVLQQVSLQPLRRCEPLPTAERLRCQNCTCKSLVRLGQSVQWLTAVLCSDLSAAPIQSLSTISLHLHTDHQYPPNAHHFYHPPLHFRRVRALQLSLDCQDYILLSNQKVYHREY